MIGLLFKELFRKWKLIILFVIITVAYAFLIGYFGKHNNLIIAGNYLNTMGSSSSLISFMMMVFASLAFAGNKTRNALFKAGEKHSTLAIFIAQMLSIVIEYLILTAVNVGTVIFTYYDIYKSNVISVHHLKVLLTAIHANAYYMFLVLPFIILITLGIKSSIRAVASGVATGYVSQLLAWPFMLWIYRIRFLKWNPFNPMMIQSQIVSPINHTLTKLHNNEAMAGVIIYGIIYLCLILWIFGRRQKFHKLQNN